VARFRTGGAAALVNVGPRPDARHDRDADVVAPSAVALDTASHAGHRGRIICAQPNVDTRARECSASWQNASARRRAHAIAAPRTPRSATPDASVIPREPYQ
jgi:hypothetical protein